MTKSGMVVEVLKLVLRFALRWALVVPISSLLRIFGGLMSFHLVRTTVHRKITLFDEKEDS